MRFRWEEAKRHGNLKKHGLDFSDAEAVFAGLTFTFADDRFDYGECRFTTIGRLDEVVVIIAHTETEKEVRVISMRKANKREQAQYFQNLSN